MATANPKPQDRQPTPEQLGLIEALIAEPTMARVAAKIGRSPRHTRRLITTLLNDLGVQHVRAAIALAVSNGWITPNRLNELGLLKSDE